MLLHGQIRKLSGIAQHVVSSAAELDGGKEAIAILPGRSARQTSQENRKVSETQWMGFISVSLQYEMWLFPELYGIKSLIESV